MAKRPSELERALGPVLSPRDTAEDRLSPEAGRAIVALSNIENRLAMMFAILSAPAPTEIAKKLFYSARTFEQRLELVNFIVIKDGEANEIRKWRKIYARLHTHKGVRNLIAHQGLLRGSPDALGNRPVSLRPLWYKTSKKLENSYHEGNNSDG